MIGRRRDWSSRGPDHGRRRLFALGHSVARHVRRRLSLNVARRGRPLLVRRRSEHRQRSPRHGRGRVHRVVVTGRRRRLQRLQVVLDLLLLRMVMVMVVRLQQTVAGRRPLDRRVSGDHRFPFRKVRQEKPSVVTASVNGLRRRRGRRRGGRGRVIVRAVSGRRRRRFPIVHSIQHRRQVVERRVVFERVAAAQRRPLFKIHPR